MAPVAVVLALLSSLLSGPASVRLYSDLCQEAESGDVGGHYVRLDADAAGFQLDYGATEGVVDKPVRAHRVRFDAAMGRLSFKVTTWESLSFRGSLADGLVSGEMRHGDGRTERVRLPRVDSLAPPYPACR